jgi:hypothetical protein
MSGILKKIAVFLILTIIGTTAYPKNNGVGGALIYNFQTNSVGLDLRDEIPLKNIYFLEGITLAPQLAYFPSFNKVHEFFVGTSVHLGLISMNKWKFYALGNLSYNGWINYENSSKKNAKFSNLGMEGGVGATTNKCIRPFLEVRYNVKWQEANIRLGLIYTIKCEKRGAVPCSKIPKQPEF